MTSTRAQTRDYPLTYAQKRLFFLHQMDSSAGTYGFPVHVRLHGLLDVQALSTALNEIAQRHDVLRSTISSVKGEPRQIVGDGDLSLRHLDLRAADKVDIEGLLREAVRTETSTPFDFSQGLARGLLIRLEDEHFVLLLTFHHIVFDGWSFGVFADELADGYLRGLGKLSDVPEPLVLQYGEYAEREATESFEVEETFWRDRLASVPPTLQLPTDRPRPVALSGAADRVWTYLDAELTTALAQRARQQRVTVYMMLLAAYEALLGRIAVQSDFCVGGASSGRSDPATHPMIGTLVNELVYRSDYTPGLSFDELIRRVRASALAAYRHDKLPFERLVEVVSPPRSLSYHPVFQHAVTMQPDQTGGAGIHLHGMEISTFDSGGEGSALDLAVSFHREGDRLACVADYSSDLWDRPWTETFVADLQRILRAMVDEPAQAVDTVALQTRTADRQPEPQAPRQDDDSAELNADTIAAARVKLAEIWTKVLGLESVRSDDNYFDIGGDSLLGLQVVSAARNAGFSMRPRHLFLAQTVAELAELLIREGGQAAAPTTAQSAPPLAAGQVPLLPIQSWFLTGPDPEAGQYNFTNLFEVRLAVSDQHLQTAVEAALAHHDAFRILFNKRAGKWRQTYQGEPAVGSLRKFDLSHLARTQASRAFDHAVRTCQSTISLRGGPLVSVALFRLPDSSRRLLVAAHHLIMDPASMRVLVDDIATGARQLTRGETVDLLPAPTTYQEWGITLARHSASPDLRDQLPYWRSVLEAAPGRLMVDLQGINDVASQETLSCYLSRETTLALRGAPATITEIVLAAAGEGLVEVVAGGDLLIDFETHGREDIFDAIDISRTVGWFSALFPLHASTTRDLPTDERLRVTMETMRAVPQGGLGFGVLAYMADDLPTTRNQVGVTYLGAIRSELGLDAPLTLLDSPGHDRSPRMTRPHELEIGAIIVDDVLEFSITYSRNRYAAARIEAMADRMRWFFERIATGSDTAQSPTERTLNP